MSSTSNNAAVTGNDAVDDVMATSQSAENGTSHDTADGDIKNDVLSSFISIGRIMAYRAIHRRLVSPGAKSPRGEHAFDHAWPRPRLGHAQGIRPDQPEGLGRDVRHEPPGHGRTVEETGGQRSHQPPSIQAGQPRHDGQPHQPGPQGRRSAGQSARPDLLHAGLSQ